MKVVISQPLNFSPGWEYREDSPNSIHETLRWRIANRSYTWRPPTDVYETEDAIVIRVEIAGMREDDFSIQILDRTLQIRGTRQDVPERRAYHQMEIPFGEFNTEIELMAPIIVEQVEAVYRDGFLRIVCPKARPQQIRVGD
jgi:HSP20 family protein